VRRLLASSLWLENKSPFSGEEQRKIFQQTSKDGASKKDRSEEGEGTL